MEIVRTILVFGLGAAALGLAFETLLPASRGLIAVAAAVAGIATLLVPPLLLAVFWNKKPKTAFGGVGLAITILVVAGSLSAVGMALALLALVFGRETSLAFVALTAIAILWGAGIVFVAVVNRRNQRRETRLR